MRKVWLVVSTLGLIVGSVAPALAGPITSSSQFPTGTIKIDATTFAVTFVFDSSKQQFLIPFQTFTTAAGDRAQISGLLNPDPFVSYAVGFTDTGAVGSNFIVTFSMPLVPPIAGPNKVFASLGGSMTDSGGNGVSIAPFLQATVQKADVKFPTTNMGVDVGPSASHPGGVTPGTAYSYGPFNAGPQAGPIAPLPPGWTELDVTLAFTGSGGGDLYSFNGFASIDSVPEPATFLLLGSGLVGLLALRRYKALRT